MDNFGDDFFVLIYQLAVFHRSTDPHGVFLNELIYFCMMEHTFGRLCLQPAAGYCDTRPEQCFIALSRLVLCGCLSTGVL
jgi:hypothetical protein